MIYLDSNIPMYLVGADHPNKWASMRLIEQLVTQRRRIVTSVETLQEILHRYVNIRRHAAIQPVFDALHGMVDDVVPVTSPDLEVAKQLVLAYETFSARDALHVAVMRRLRCTTIATFDRGFDQIPGVARVPN